MKATLISKENNEAKFKMEFTAEEFEEALNKAYKATRNQYKVNGFRNGKAPRSIIEKHYGDGIFFQDAINDILRDSYEKALLELELDVIDSPGIDFTDLEKGKGFTATLDVKVYPVIEVKDYKGISAEQLDPEITDETVDAEIETLRKRNARIENVDRPVKSGDKIIFGYAGFVGDDQFDGGTAENQELEIGSGNFIPGFEDQLVGVSAGEKKDVEVTFPEEYHSKDLAGKDAVFHCEIHEVKEEILPDVDDEFAKDVSEFDTIDEFKDDIRKKLEEAALRQAKNGAKDFIVEELYKANEVETPNVLVEEELDKMINDLNQQIMYQGFSIEQYLQMTGKDMKSFRDEMRDEAKKKVASRIILLSIVEAENLKATEDDINKELENLAKLYQSDVENVRNMVGEANMPFFAKDVAINKVLDFLYDEAEIKHITPEEWKAKNEKDKVEAEKKDEKKTPKKKTAKKSTKKPAKAEKPESKEIKEEK